MCRTRLQSKLTTSRGLQWLAAQHLTGDAEDTLRRLERVLRAVHQEVQHADAACARARQRMRSRVA